MQSPGFGEDRVRALGGKPHRLAEPGIPPDRRVQTRAERVRGRVARFWSRGGAPRQEKPGWVVPTPPRPIPAAPAPQPRDPGPPLMPAMVVTSLLAPRPGRWPGDPRRAAAARQHPEVHAAALPPAARAGAWGRAGPARPPSFAGAGPAGTCGAGPWFPSGPGGSTGPKAVPAASRPREEEGGRDLGGIVSLSAPRAHFSSHHPVSPRHGKWVASASPLGFLHGSGSHEIPTSIPLRAQRVLDGNVKMHPLGSLRAFLSSR